QAGEDVGDVGQVGLVRTDEQHAAPAVTEARVGVDEIRGAVQGDDGLSCTRTAVDDEGAAGPRADDGVLVGLDGAEHVAHPGRPRVGAAGWLPGRAMRADWSSSAWCPSTPPEVNTSSQ